MFTTCTPPPAPLPCLPLCTPTSAPLPYVPPPLFWLLLIPLPTYPLLRRAGTFLSPIPLWLGVCLQKKFYKKNTAAGGLGILWGICK